MNETSRSELETLQVRAYGPHADIDSDPAARERLSELEDILRAESAFEPAPAATAEVSASDPAQNLLDSLGLQPADASVEASFDASTLGALVQPGMPERAPNPIPRFWLTAWAGSVALVAVLVGALVFGLASIPSVPTATGARQIATLDERVEPPAWLIDWFGASGDGDTYRYLGMLVARSQFGQSGPGSDCLVVIAEDAYVDSDQALRGEVYSGCRAGSFPPTAQFVVGASSPEALRAKFPEGTALQFVLGDGRVGVFSDDGRSMPIPAKSA